MLCQCVPLCFIASNATTRIQTISCFSVREPGAALSPLAMHFECVSSPPIPTKRYESEPNLPKPKLLLPNAGRSNRHCLYRKDAQPAKKWQVNSVLPPRRLIAPSLLTTEIVARSKHSSNKKLLLHEKLPKPPKGASKLTSFVLSLPYACTRPCGPKVFLLLRALASLSRSPSTSASAVVCARASLEPGPTLVDMVTTGFGPGGQ